MANYTISTQWQSLSTIMGNNYDNTKQYRIHNNVELPAKLCITDDETPTADIIGRIYPAYCDIYVDASLNSKIRVGQSINSQFGYNIEITEVE